MTKERTQENLPQQEQGGKVKKRTKVIGVLLLLAVLLLALGTAETLFALRASLLEPPTLVYGTYIGQDAWEQAYGIAVDEEGYAYVTGYTQSITFPLSLENQEPLHGIDVIALKVGPTGSTMDYALWFNAETLNAEDYGYDVAVGNDGSVYVAGLTNSDDFCQFFGNFPGYDTIYNGSGDAFVLKIKPDGSTLDYCTYLGDESDLDIARAIAIDDEGNAYVAGGTWSAGFVTTDGAFDTTHNGLRDVFVTKLDPTGTMVLYSTFIGGGLQDEATALAVGEDGSVTLTGWTTSTDFYTSDGAFDPEHNGGIWDTFVVQLNAAGSDVVYSTFIGGDDDDKGTGVALDSSGRAYLTGYTRSANFPVTDNAFDGSYGGGTCSATPCYDAFVARLSPAGDHLEYATYLGDDGEDMARSIAVDEAGKVYVTGGTASATFPVTADALDSTLDGNRDAFMVIFDESGTDVIYASFLGGSANDEAFGLALGPVGLYLTGLTFSPDFPTSEGAYDTSHNGDYDVFVTAYELPAEPPPPPPPAYQLYLPSIVK